MARLRKCFFCGEDILPTEISIPYKKRYAHDYCFNKAMKTLSQGKKDQLEAVAKQKKKKLKNPVIFKDGMTEEEYADKKKYYKYLSELVNNEPLSVKQLAVSERYIERYGFTFEGMYQTLVYLNEILEKDLQGDIVGIIPYYYSESEQFYNDLNAIEENSKKVSLKESYPDKVVYIKPRKRQVKEMDIEGIGKE